MKPRHACVLQWLYHIKKIIRIAHDKITVMHDLP